MVDKLDYPLHEVAVQADEMISHGAKIWQKWTCQHCGARQIMEEANKFYLSGRCEECSQISKILECNFMAMFGGDP